MECKILYNIETNTLIKLDPAGMSLEVRSDFTQLYHMSKENFLLLYILSLAHPHIVYYSEIMHILSDIGVRLNKTSELKKLVKELKMELNSYSVKKLIIEVKNTGYGISNKWVIPSQIKEQKDAKFINYLRRMCKAALMSK